MNTAPSSAQHRRRLPQLDADVFLADGGIETSLIDDQGLELPDFAAFTLLDNPDGRAALIRYFADYIALAQRDRIGIVLETPTWRANPDWGPRHGYDLDGLARLDQIAVELLVELRNTVVDPVAPIVISGCIGPRGDAYRPESLMTAAESQRYHAAQVEAFAASPADLVSALTMTHTGEAIGVARAAAAADMPVVISFTVETDGALPTGQALRDAIIEVDQATDASVAYYMVNCSHPTHFADVLEPGAGWDSRIRGIRANASTASHAELDNAEVMDTGDPVDLAQRYVALRETHPSLVVLGGCCGTNHRHIDAISAAVRA